MKQDKLKREVVEPELDYEKYKNDFFEIYDALWTIERFYAANIQKVEHGSILRDWVHVRLGNADVVGKCQTFAIILPKGSLRKLFALFSSAFQDVSLFLAREDADLVENITKIRRSLERIRRPLGRFMKQRGWIKSADWNPLDRGRM